MVLKFPVGINSRTEVNSPQGTAPVRYRLFVQEKVPSVQGDHSLWRKESGSNQLSASTLSQPLEEMGTLGTTYTQPAAQLLGGRAPLAFSLVKKHISQHTSSQQPLWSWRGG